MIRPNRLLQLTPEEQARKDAANIRATAPAGETYSGTTYFGSSEGYVTPTPATPTPPTTIQGALDQARDVKSFTPTQRTDASGAVWETQQGGTERMISRGAETPIQENQRRAEELRKLVGQTTDAQQREILQAELGRMDADIYNATTGLDVKSRDIENQIKATMIAKGLRTEDIKTKPGEAGQKIGSQVAAMESKYATSPEGVTTSGATNVIGQAGIAGEMSLKQAIASDPELANLNNRLIQLSTGQQSVAQARKDISSGEFKAIQNFFTNSVAKEEALKKELQATDNARVEKWLTPDSLGALAANPDMIDYLIKNHPKSTYTAADITYMAIQQKKINEFMLKKTLMPEEQTKLDQAKATLAKTLAENAQIGVEKPTDLSQKHNLLNGLLTAGIIDQAGYNKGMETLAGISTDGKYSLKELDGRLYSQDEKTGKTTLVNSDQNGNLIVPQFSQVGNGNITYDYGSRSLNANDNVLLQNGAKGHPAVDIDGNSGDAVQAFVSGTVTQIANNGGYGNQVVITDKSGSQHMYSHLRELPDFIAIGQQVNAGAVIGRMGNTGSVFDLNGKPPGQGDLNTGSHLDYRIKGTTPVNGSVWINPNTYKGVSGDKNTFVLTPDEGKRLIDAGFTTDLQGNPIGVKTSYESIPSVIRNFAQGDSGYSDMYKELKTGFSEELPNIALENKADYIKSIGDTLSKFKVSIDPTTDKDGNITFPSDFETIFYDLFKSKNIEGVSQANIVAQSMLDAGMTENEVIDFFDKLDSQDILNAEYDPDTQTVISNWF